MHWVTRWAQKPVPNAHKGYNPSCSFIFGRLSGLQLRLQLDPGPPCRDLKLDTMSPKGGSYVSVET